MRQQELMQRYTPAALCAKLEEAAEEANAKSEETSETFLVCCLVFVCAARWLLTPEQDGDMKVNDFVKQYLQVRKLYHLRAAKCEKLRAMA